MLKVSFLGPSKFRFLRFSMLSRQYLQNNLRSQHMFTRLFNSGTHFVHRTECRGTRSRSSTPRWWSSNSASQRAPECSAGPRLRPRGEASCCRACVTHAGCTPSTQYTLLASLELCTAPCQESFRYAIKRRERVPPWLHLQDLVLLVSAY